jgi:hypothetical protein
MLRGLWAAEFVGGKPRAALDHANEFLSLAQSGGRTYRVRGNDV